LAHKKESILADLSQPEPVVMETPSFTATVQAIVVPQQPTSATTSIQTDTVAKLVEDFKELKLFVIQGQNARAKSPQYDRPTAQRSVQFVTCHSCGKRGHYKLDCLDNVQGRPQNNNNSNIASSSKSAEINLLEFTRSRTLETGPKVMMAKRPNTTQEPEPPVQQHRKSKSKRDEGPSMSSRTKRTRRKIGNEDLLLSQGQQEFPLYQI
jgi:hypothetical protein